MAVPSPPPSLGAYVPRIVRQWLDDDPAATHRRLDGTMVLVDVSGFTSMTERLARFGKVGAEAVTTIIGERFDLLLAEAYAYGGTLVKFGGDALLLFFHGDGDAARACSAALAMRATLRRHRDIATEAGRVTLRMSVGVHTDAIDAFLVGSSHRELLVTGPAATEIVRLEGAANPGQILISAGTADSLGRRHVGPAIGQDYLLRGPVPSTDRQEVAFRRAGQDLRPVVPLGLRSLLAGGTAPSEHRHVGIAFVHVGGVDALIADQGPAATAVQLDGLLSRLQRAVDARRVCFLATDVAADGVKVLLASGAPETDGDDEERLLLAIRELLDGEHRLPMRVGVSAGYVVAGEIGTIHRRTYTVMGDTVNLAARLMARAAPGQLLATQAALNGSRTLFETDDLAPFLVKGKRLPVAALAVGRPRGVRSAIASSELALVGREIELGQILDVVQGLGSPSSAENVAVVELVGEAGVGKSRLLTEVARRAGAMQVHRLQCRPYQAGTPYFAAGELLRDLLGLGPSEDAEAKESALRAVIAGRAPALTPWLSLLAVPLGLDLEDSPEAAALEEAFRKRQLVRAIVELVEALVVQPTLVCVEDVHWVDDASAEVLQALARVAGDRPWLICLTRRPTDRSFTDESGSSTAEPRTLTVTLAPLGPAATAELVATALGERALPRHVLAALTERAGGHPLLTLELLHAYQQGDDIDELPRSVEALIAARVDRLRPHDRTTLRHLAVLGNAFEARHAAAVLSGEHLAPADLARLDAFLQPDGAGDDLRLRFRHALVRDVAYAGLPFATRRDLHGRVAESILKSVGSGAEPAPLLSLHFFHAHRFDEAWRYSRTAGDEARALYANLEAIGLYERALRSAKQAVGVPSTEQADVLLALGDVQDLAGRFAGARRAYLAAQALVADEPRRLAELDLKLAFVSDRQGRYASAVRSIRRGQKRLDSLADGSTDAQAAQLGAQLTVWLAAIRAGQGRTAEAARWARKGVELAAAAGDDQALARAHLVVDYTDHARGGAEAGLGSRTALAIYERIGDLSGQATATNNLGVYAYHEGRWSEAIELYQRSREARLRTGDPANAAMADANIAEILVGQGRWDEAEELLGGAAAAWREADEPWGIAFSQLLSGTAASRLGRSAEADELLATARHAFATMGAGNDVTVADVAMAEHLVLNGRSSEAASVLERVAREGRRGELGTLEADVQRLRGLAMLQLGQPPGQVAVELEAAVHIARERDAPYPLAQALEALSLVTRANTGIGRAREHEELFERLGVVRRPAVPVVTATG